MNRAEPALGRRRCAGDGAPKGLALNPNPETVDVESWCWCLYYL